MARKGDVELEIPWWVFLAVIVGGYVWFRYSTDNTPAPARYGPIYPPATPGLVGDKDFSASTILRRRLSRR